MLVTHEGKTDISAKSMQSVLVYLVGSASRGRVEAAGRGARRRGTRCAVTRGCATPRPSSTAAAPSHRPQIPRA